MRKYEFHSALPPELVFSIVSTKAQEVWHPYLTDTFTAAERFFYRRDGECLWLTYTGTMPRRGFIPFSATVRAEGTGSVISGGFSVWRAIWKQLTVCSAVLFFAALLFGAPLWMAALGAVLAFFWFSLTTQIMQKPFWKRQQAVLEFIEQHLLE